MRKIVMAVALFAAVFASAYEGPTFTVSVWRGETAYAQIPGKFAGEMLQVEGIDDGMEQSGVGVELYGLNMVCYDTTPGGSFLNARRDVLRPMAHAKTKEDGYCYMPPAFCRVVAAPDAKPGERQFGPLVVRVVDRALPPPKDWKYFLDLWQHPWAVARFAGAEPFSEQHYQAMEPVWRALAESGVKALTVTLLDLPWNHQCYDAYHSMVARVKTADGKWKFDYSLFDRYVEFGRKCGIGPDIACYTMCPWGYVVRWQDEKGETQRVRAVPGTPEFEDFWGDFLVDFAAHLKAKGWFDDAYIAMDERSPEDVRNIALFIQKKAPGMKISMAGNRKPSEFKDIVIDNYSQGLTHMTPDFLPELALRREKGWKTTFYVCCSPERPNTFMASPDGEGFWIGAYPALVGFDGFLRWAANSWPHDPYVDASFGDWKAGDTYLIYPGGELSARLVALRAGIVAAEKLRILRESGALGDEVTVLADEFGYKAAMSGKLNFGAFRRKVEALVNR